MIIFRLLFLDITNEKQFFCHFFIIYFVVYILAYSINFIRQYLLVQLHAKVNSKCPYQFWFVSLFYKSKNLICNWFTWRIWAWEYMSRKDFVGISITGFHDCWFVSFEFVCYDQFMTIWCYDLSARSRSIFHGLVVALADIEQTPFSV